MDRRKFIRSATVLAVSSLMPSFAKARLSCGPWVPPGIQGCTAGINSALIPVTAFQQMNQWCWAACIEMVFRYYGFKVSQAKIVEDTWGNIINMPGSPGQILADLNRDWTDQFNRDFTTNGDSYSANAMTAAQDLANDMPLIIGTMGHAVVLTRLDYFVDLYGNGDVKSATVRDPWPGRGRRVLSPQEWYNISFAARIRVQAS